MPTTDRSRRMTAILGSILTPPITLPFVELKSIYWRRESGEREKRAVPTGDRVPIQPKFAVLSAPDGYG